MGKFYNPTTQYASVTMPVEGQRTSGRTQKGYTSRAYRLATVDKTSPRMQAALRRRYAQQVSGQRDFSKLPPYQQRRFKRQQELARLKKLREQKRRYEGERSSLPGSTGVREGYKQERIIKPGKPTIIGTERRLPPAYAGIQASKLKGSVSALPVTKTLWMGIYRGKQELAKPPSNEVIKLAEKTFKDNPNAISVTVRGYKFVKGKPEIVPTLDATIEKGEGQKLGRLRARALERSGLLPSQAGASDTFLKRTLQGAGVLGVLGVVRGIKGVADFVNPLKLPKNIKNTYSQVRYPLQTIELLGRQYTIDPVGTITEFATLNKLLNVAGRTVKNSKVGSAVAKELYLAKIPISYRPKVRIIINAVEAQLKIKPVRGLKIDYVKIKSIKPYEIKALDYALRKNNAVIFGSAIQGWLKKSRLPIKDLDFALPEALKNQFNKDFIGNLPKSVRKNYLVKGSKLYRRIRNIREAADQKGVRRVKGKLYDPIFDIKTLDKLRPQASTSTFIKTTSWIKEAASYNLPKNLANKLISAIGKLESKRLLVKLRKGQLPVSGYQLVSEVIKTIKTSERLIEIRALLADFRRIKKLRKLTKKELKIQKNLVKEYPKVRKQLRELMKGDIFSKLPKITRDKISDAYRVPTQKLVEVEGKLLSSFGEQVARKAFGTLQVLIEKNPRRAKDPQALLEGLRVQLESLKARKPARQAKLSYLKWMGQVDRVEKAIKMLESKEFAKLLESKLPGILDQYPLLRRINPNTLGKLDKKRARRIANTYKAYTNLLRDLNELKRKKASNTKIRALEDKIAKLKTKLPRGYTAKPKKILKIRKKIIKRRVSRLPKRAPSKLPRRISSVLSALSTSKLRALTPSILKNIKANSQLKSLVPSKLQNITVSQLNKLTPSQLVSITTSMLARIPPSQLPKVVPSRLVRIIGRKTPKITKTKKRKKPEKEGLKRKIKDKRVVKQNFEYTSDLYSRFFGIEAKRTEAEKLLKPGRVFTGLEIRKKV